MIMNNLQLNLYMMKDGEAFKIIGLCRTGLRANALLKENEDSFIIATDNDGNIYIAKNEPNEWGQPVKWSKGDYIKEANAGR